MARMIDTALPLVAAPMAGGVTTQALVRAVGAAGGFAFWPAGYRDPAAFAADLAALRADGVGAGTYGVNLFAPHPTPIGEEAFRRYARRIQPDADRFGLVVADAPLTSDDDGWAAKIDVLLADPVPVVSVTFGLPPVPDLRALQRVGTRVLTTVTTAEEARAAADLGLNGLVVQGGRAGGHSATFDPRHPIQDRSTSLLVAEVRAATGLPVIAAGGVDGPDAVRDLLAAGAEAVAVGTLLLRSPESGAPRVHQDALVDPGRRGTVVTTAFTGRPARALRNVFTDHHTAEAPLGYPALHHLTRPIRRAAGQAGDAEYLHLWAGTGHRSAQAAPAADIVIGLGRLG